LRYGIDILHSSSNTWKLLFGTYTYIRSYCRADQATDISSNSCPRLFRGNYCEGIASSTSANCRLQLYMATRGGNGETMEDSEHHEWKRGLGRRDEEAFSGGNARALCILRFIVRHSSSNLPA